MNSSRGSRSSVVCSVTARAWSPRRRSGGARYCRGTAPAGASRARRGPRRRAPGAGTRTRSRPGIGQIGIPRPSQVARPAAVGASTPPRLRPRSGSEVILQGGPGRGRRSPDRGRGPAALPPRREERERRDGAHGWLLRLTSRGGGLVAGTGPGHGERERPCRRGGGGRRSHRRGPPPAAQPVRRGRHRCWLGAVRAPGRRPAKTPIRLVNGPGGRSVQSGTAALLARNQRAR